jgi:hypothetical protein
VFHLGLLLKIGLCAIEHLVHVDQPSRSKPVAAAPTRVDEKPTLASHGATAAELLWACGAFVII